MTNHYDTGYKELFSHPEFVQQLVEGFAPPEIAGLMDFTTLQNHNGNYITRCSKSASKTPYGRSKSQQQSCP